MFSFLSRSVNCFSRSVNCFSRSVNSQNQSFLKSSLIGTPWSRIPVLQSSIRFMAIANFRPKRTRFKKVFKGTLKIRQSSLRGTRVYHGDYGLQLTKGGRLKDKQLDTARGMIRRTIKGDKGSKFFLRLFPHRPVTSKGSECRMGKGKGSVEEFATWARAGDMVFEIKGARMEIAHKALKNAAACLPLPTRIVKASELKVAPRTLPFFIKKKLDLL